MKMGNTPHSQ